MRFLVDECTGPAVAQWLREQGHQVLDVFSEARGACDDDLIARAATENWIIITNDKDFGEKARRFGRPHSGIVLLRLADERSTSKVRVVQELIATYSEKLADRFVVVTETHVRMASG